MKNKRKTLSRVVISATTDTQKRTVTVEVTGPLGTVTAKMVDRATPAGRLTQIVHAADKLAGAYPGHADEILNFCVEVY